MKIYVGNLPYDATESDLRGLFEAHGEVSEIAMITDKFSGQPKGFCFVEMPNQAEAEAAIKALDSQPLKGRNIKVNPARPREERPKRRPGR